MEDAILYSRLQFAFTITFHYLFPQLTMGLSLLIVVFKFLNLRNRSKDPALAENYALAAKFWARIFGINFAMGVATGIPMEFQFGTNWAKFSAAAGGVIGNTLALEGVFAFFLESTFLGLFLYGERLLHPIAHFFAAFMVFFGSWCSGLFIVATNAWMQHPVAYEISPEGSYQLASLWDLLTNPWLPAQYFHTMLGSVVTSCFVVASVGAFYLLARYQELYGRLFLKIATPIGLVASILLAYPTGDRQAKDVAHLQPVTFAAMEGLFEDKHGANLVLIGQPDMENLEIDNPIEIPNMLSFLLYENAEAHVKGLKSFPRELWPTNVPLLYYSYHIMAGLGTLFILILCVACFKLWRGTLATSNWVLWTLFLAAPFPYIANTAGWMTAELGRQPWLIYGLMRTSEGASTVVSSGNVLFSLLGFIGLYLVLGLLFLVLLLDNIKKGPAALAQTKVV
jgi:cytochrome d ubiquinol oxidase subunit I